MLVVLHGLGDSSEGWEWLPQELQLPWMNYLLVNAPDEYFSGRSWFGIRFPMDGRVDGWVDGCLDGWTDGWHGFEMPHEPRKTAW